MIINDMIKRWWSWWQAQCQPQGDQAPECIGSRFSLPWISSLTSTQQTDRFDTKPQILIFWGRSANHQASYQSWLSFVFKNYWHFLGFHIFLFSSGFLANTFVRLNQISEFGGVCTWGEAQWWNNSCFGRTPNGSLGGLVLCLSASKFALAMDCLHRVIQSNFS